MNLRIRAALPLLTALFLLLAGIPSLSAQSASYHLIAGSFDDFPSANLSAQNLRSQGLDAMVLSPLAPGQNYRVSAYQSNERQRAETFARKVKQQKGRKNWWILSVEGQDLTGNGNMRSPIEILDPSVATYHLIMGSFDRMEDAYQGVQNLTAKGFEPYVLSQDPLSQQYRVSVFRSQEREEITAYQRLLRKRGREDGWILESQGQVAGAKSRNVGSPKDYSAGPGAGLVGTTADAASSPSPPRQR